MLWRLVRWLVRKNCQQLLCGNWDHSKFLSITHLAWDSGQQPNPILRQSIPLRHASLYRSASIFHLQGYCKDYITFEALYALRPKHIGLRADGTRILPIGRPLLGGSGCEFPSPELPHSTCWQVSLTTISSAALAWIYCKLEAISLRILFTVTENDFLLKIYW